MKLAAFGEPPSREGEDSLSPMMLDNGVDDDDVALTGKDTVDR